MRKPLSLFVWFLIAMLGAVAYYTIATRRAEPLNSGYLLAAALCSYAIGYRFYAKWIAARVLALNDLRATPCEAHEDGRDFVKTNKWIVFGHHFAAISGPGPLVGPVLAAQFGYLPGTLWILIGVVLGGAVQDFVVLFASIRRDGKSLGQMLKEELNAATGVVGLITILSIMTILLAVLALVVINLLAESPWGVFTVGATIPIAMLMGGYLRYLRVGKVLEVSAIGVVLLLLSVWGGKFIHTSPELAGHFALNTKTLAGAIILYGFAASVMPVWLLLAPRDYLSTFMKLGTIFALVLGVFLVLPDLRMPALSKFVDGSGLVVPGTIFPFCFITIACGAISGFHTLISSGITPKIVTRESYALPIGYGAMLLESLVAMVAMIAACTVDPSVYLAMNVKGAGTTPAAIEQSTKAKVDATGFTSFERDLTHPGHWLLTPVNVSIDGMHELAAQMGERTLFGKTGGAATLAVGMAGIFSKLTHGRWLDVWYHFAMMFEALFILTTLDAGTRVGRYLVQDALGQVWPAIGRTGSMPAALFASALVVASWGFFVVRGVLDPTGGVTALWPIFGIANQILAAVALSLATTILLKMTLRRPGNGLLRCAPALVTLVPMIWLLVVTISAALAKVGDSKISFLTVASATAASLPELEAKAAAATGEALVPAQAALKAAHTLLFNSRVDAAVTIAFIALIAVVLLLSVLKWVELLRAAEPPKLHETEPVWLSPASIGAPDRPLPVMGLIALGLVALKEISGEADIDRERAAQTAQCECQKPETPRARQNVYLTTTERRFNGIRRCC